MLTRPESTSTPDCVVKRWWGQFIYRWGQLGGMRKALVLMMTTCILFAGCIEGLTETTEDTIKEMAPGCNDPTALNYDEDDTSDSTCMSQEMMGAAIDDFSTLVDADEPPANMGIKMTMTGVDEEMDMGAYSVEATMAENENTVHSGSEITISSMGMTISQAWTITSSDDGGTLMQVTYMDQSFLMNSAMSMEDVIAAADAEETEEQSSGEMDMEMPDAADMVTMLGAWGDCVECPMPTAHAYDGKDLTVTYQIDAQNIEMDFSMNTDGTWMMTSYSYDTGNESMGVEILSAEEASALLTIDTTLGYEALPFTIEEDSVFVCDDGEEIPPSWENDGMDDCSDGSDENGGGWLKWEGEIVADAEFAFAGALDDYSIVLANCTEEDDDMGDTTLTCDEALMSVSLGDAKDAYDLAAADLQNSTGPVIWDEDGSGTLTDGDAIMVGGNTSGEWTHVRLHSNSADAYSDENPTLMPGFTTILGVLSLMGAAMMGRRD